MACLRVKPRTAARGRKPQSAAKDSFIFIKDDPSIPYLRLIHPPSPVASCRVWDHDQTYWVLFPSFNLVYHPPIMLWGLDIWLGEDRRKKVREINEILILLEWRRENKWND